jgi:hypothetical protein
LREAIDAILANSGLTIGDLYPKAKRAGGRGKAAVKFRNPKDPSQT